MKLQSEVASVHFGSPRSLASEDGLRLDLAVPVLAGNPIARQSLGAGNFSRKGDWSIWRSDTMVHAQGLVRVAGSPTGTTRRLYREAFEIAGDLNLYRFWNFIPGINRETDGLENYRSFALGRNQAFVERFGPEGAPGRMPAATGVGIDDNALVVILLAGTEKPEYLENPNQVPAYRYPDFYGPQPPSFARATRVRIDGLNYGFLSGTSSVLGCRSAGVGDLRRQTEVTLENLDTMAGQMGLSASLGRGQGLERKLRVYLRRSTDLEVARSLIEERLLEPGDDVVWLRSEICRSDLDIEIDATVIG